MLKKIGSILILFFCLYTYAEEINIDAYVSMDTAGIEDTFVYSIKVETRGGDMNFDISPPSFENFEIISTSRSSSFSMVNNAVSRGIINNYTLRPKEIGKFTIKGASIEYRGNQYTVKPIAIEIKEGSVSPQRSSSRRPDPFDSMFERRRPQRRQLAEDDVFLQMSVNNTKPYIYEQVILTISYYKKPHILADASLEPMELEDFWREELDPDSHQDVGYTYKNNQRYMLHKIHFVVYPTRTGELVLPGAKVSLTTSSLFSSMPVILESNPVKINVRSLPDSVVMPVGEFSMDIELEEKNEYVENQPLSLILSMNGTGRFRDDDININNFDNAFEIYPPRKSIESNFSGNRFRTNTKYEYIIIPRKSGEIQIPEFSLIYFDTAGKKVRTIKSEKITLNISPSPDGKTPHIISDADTAKRDILYLMQYNPRIRNPKGSGVYYHIQILFFISAVLSIILGYYKQRSSRSPLTAKKRAYADAIKKLKKINRIMDPKEASKALANILQSYLDRRWTISSASLTRQELICKLKESGISADCINNIIKLLDILNEYAYNPEQNNIMHIDPIKIEIEKIIEKTRL